MMSKLCSVGVLISVMWLAETSASAQEPTFSFEATEINGVRIENGPSGEIRAVPGDRIRVDMFLRDWSVDGELIRAYQASIDKRGYTSGFQGTVQPVDYDSTTMSGSDNKKNAFIDTDDPRYIFLNRQNFGVTDTMSPGYRWMGALVDADECMVAKQDGKKYYTGTIMLEVSEKANGPFTIRFLEPEWASSLRDPKNNPIMGLRFEPLVINVGAPVLRIVGSEIDGDSADQDGVLRVLGGNARKGWSELVLRASVDASGAKASDFVLSDGTDHPPHVKSLRVVGRVVTLELDKPIAVGRWTFVKHTPSKSEVRFGSLPGDVTADGVLGTNDFAALVDAAISGRTLPLHRSDIDGNGKRDPGDAIQLLELLAEPDAYRARLRN